MLSHQGYLEPSATHSMGRAGGQSHGVSDSLRSSQPEKNQVPNPGHWLPDPAMAATSSLVSIPKVLCHPKLLRDSNYQRLLALCRVRYTLPLSYVGGKTLMPRKAAWSSSQYNVIDGLRGNGGDELAGRWCPSFRSCTGRSCSSVPCT